jgi:hypothetical protein
VIGRVPKEPSPPKRPPLLGEQHCCLPLERHADVGELARYRRAGGGFVSVHVGCVPHGADDVTGLVARRWERIVADDRLRPVATVDDIDDIGDIGDAVRAGDVSVAFGLEDSGPKEGDLDRCGTSTISVCARCRRAATRATRPARSAPGAGQP